MCVWQPERKTGSEEEDQPALRVTVRLSPPRLGRVQVDLTSKRSGSLTCRLGAENPAAARLLARHAEVLAEAFAKSGWPSCEVTCRPRSEWPPLWPGGETLSTPRACVDRFV